MHLTQKPHKVLKINDESRRDVGSFKLYSIEDLSRCQGLTYEFKVPTVTPAGWSTSKYWRTITNYRAYMEKFNELFPEIHEVLLDNPNIVVAGSAASCLLAPDYTKALPGDIDLFIVCNPSEDIWDIAKRCLKSILAIYKFKTPVLRNCSFYIIPGLITVHTAVGINVQIILRRFQTIGGLLHGFDIPSCSVAVTANEVYMTYAAMWAHTFKVNIVSPKYRSTTYEGRLKKYFNRGYAIALPDMDIIICDEDGGELILPHITITYSSIEGNKINGTISCAGGPKSDYEPDSDYSNDYCSLERNYKQIALGKNQFALFAKGCDNVDDFITEVSEKCFIGDLMEYKTYVFKIELAAHMLAKSKFNVSSIYLFGLSDGDILNMIRASNGEQRRLIMKPYVEKLIARYNARKDEPVNWFIKIDPSRQYTVSLNPIIEDPVDWYGKYYKDSREWCIKQFTCDICNQALLTELNTITFGCGCKAHWLKTDTCSGKPTGCTKHP